MSTWKRKNGDVRDFVDVGLRGILDITGAQVLGVVQLSSARVELEPGSVTRAQAVVSSSGRVLAVCSVRIPLGAANGWLATASPGDWNFEQQLTFPDSTVLTWPSEGYDTIRVGNDL